MLTPDQIEAAGDAVASVYSNIEAEMLEHLVKTLVSGNVLSAKDYTALALLYQTHARELEKIMADNKHLIEQVATETIEEYLDASDADDIKRLGDGAPLAPRQIDATIAGVAEILSRDNIQMIEGAKQAFFSASIDVITQVNTGNMTTEKAMHRAVRNLMRDGIKMITYQNASTGKVTIQNRVDVAVRRHIRTQIAQDGARMTLERLEKLEMPLVEVSSHEGARPTHEVWQGRCYSLKGDIEIDGHRYPDFYSSTGYGSVDGLLGANCRHSFGPYVHGAKRAYSPNPQHASGLSNDEIYQMTQKQRYIERQIRADKREVIGARVELSANESIENRMNLAQAEEKLRKRQASMREFIKESNEKSKTGVPILHRQPNREWAGDMPKVISYRERNSFTKDGRYKTKIEDVNRIVKRDLPNVKIPCEIVVNNKIKPYGRTIYEEVFPGYNRLKRIEIGAQKNASDAELRETILHEILEAKMIVRDDRRLNGGDATVHPYIDTVIAKYIKMKQL